MPTDIWSLGCIVAEMATAEALSAFHIGLGCPHCFFMTISSQVLFPGDSQIVRVLSLRLGTV